jgi:hypothetical protein
MINDFIDRLNDELDGWRSIGRLTTEEWFQKRLLMKIVRLSLMYSAGPQIHDDYDAEGNPR